MESMRRAQCTSGAHGRLDCTESPQIPPPSVGVLEVPPSCRPLLLSGSAGLSRTQGSTGGGWSSCTHLINYGLNFNFGLAQFMASVFRPTSTLELGCGLGLYSDWMHRMAGAAPALGIEPVGVHSAVFNPSARWPQQLAADFFSDAGHNLTARCAAAMRKRLKFDLVFTIEVAEHIPRELHDRVADFLAEHTAGFLVFSAGRPGQGGVGHIALRPRDEWQAEFEKRGLKYLPKTTEALRASSSAPKFDSNHRTNPLVFAARGAPKGTALDWRQPGAAKATGADSVPGPRFVPKRWFTRTREVSVRNSTFKWRGLRLQLGEAEVWPDVVLSQRACK